MSEAATVSAVLAAGADENVAFEAPGREPLNYSGLRAHVSRTVAALNAAGIGRNDRVAIALPNGPEMASAFVSIAAGATTAPLNPGYRREEFDFLGCHGIELGEALAFDTATPAQAKAMSSLHWPKAARMREPWAT